MVGIFLVQQSLTISALEFQIKGTSKNCPHAQILRYAHLQILIYFHLNSGVVLLFLLRNLRACIRKRFPPIHGLQIIFTMPRL